MTNQEKKVWLKQYGANERQIRRLEGEIERWESRAQKVTPSYSRVPGGGDGNRLQGRWIRSSSCAVSFTTGCCCGTGT